MHATFSPNDAKPGYRHRQLHPRAQLYRRHTPRGSTFEAGGQRRFFRKTFSVSRGNNVCANFKSTLTHAPFSVAVVGGPPGHCPIQRRGLLRSAMACGARRRRALQRHKRSTGSSVEPRRPFVCHLSQMQLFAAVGVAFALLQIARAQSPVWGMLFSLS